MSISRRSYITTRGFYRVDEESRHALKASPRGTRQMAEAIATLAERANLVEPSIPYEDLTACRLSSLGIEACLTNVAD